MSSGLNQKSASGRKSQNAAFMPEWETSLVLGWGVLDVLENKTVTSGGRGGYAEKRRTR